MIFNLFFVSVFVFAADDGSDDTEKEPLKNKIMNNIKKKTKEELNKIDEMELEDADKKSPETVDEAINNVSNTVTKIMLSIINNVAKISGLIVTLTTIIGIIGIIFTKNAPKVRKFYIFILISGPIIFIVSNYGPAIYFNWFLE